MGSLCGDCVFYNTDKCKCNDGQPKRGCEQGISTGSLLVNQLIKPKENKEVCK